MAPADSGVRSLEMNSLLRVWNSSAVVSEAPQRAIVLLQKEEGLHGAEVRFFNAQSPASVRPEAACELHPPRQLRSALMRRFLATALLAAASAAPLAGQGALSLQGFGYPVGQNSTRSSGTAGALGETDPAFAHQPRRRSWAPGGRCSVSRWIPSSAR